jgi:hypothetical protein
MIFRLCYRAFDGMIKDHAITTPNVKPIYEIMIFGKKKEFDTRVRIVSFDTFNDLSEYAKRLLTHKSFFSEAYIQTGYHKPNSKCVLDYYAL